MRTTTRLFVTALVLLFAVCSLGAQAKAQPQQKPAASGGFLGGRDLGLIFDLDLAAPLIALAEAGDGVQTGLGMKLWLNNQNVVRALLDLGFTTDGTNSTIVFDLGAAYEYHPVRGKLSPYVGGLLGTGVSITTTTNLTLYFGGLLGVEVQVMDAVAFFAEYALLAVIDEPNFTLDLGVGNGAMVGVVVYLQ